MRVFRTAGVKVHPIASGADTQDVAATTTEPGEASTTLLGGVRALTLFPVDSLYGFIWRLILLTLVLTISDITYLEYTGTDFSLVKIVEHIR